MDAKKNDAELIRDMLLEPDKLVLGFSFRGRLRTFLENKLITKEEHDHLLSFYEKDAEKKTKEKHI